MYSTTGFYTIAHAYHHTGTHRYMQDIDCISARHTIGSKLFIVVT